MSEEKKMIEVTIKNHQTGEEDKFASDAVIFLANESGDLKPNEVLTRAKAYWAFDNKNEVENTNKVFQIYIALIDYSTEALLRMIATLKDVDISIKEDHSKIKNSINNIRKELEILIKDEY
jgi:hypothetical protein